AEQTAFPDRNFRYNFIENGAIVNALVDISRPPSAYHLVNFDLSTKVGKGIELRLVIDNIFNSDYRNYLNRLRYFAEDTGRNFRLELSYIF
ncbi:MAG: TonB-dependent receptor, partial [Flavobacteriaceae bacterium]|nr:TonB-dependent receptor [Flavobacteriaceae bacterium]